MKAKFWGEILVITLVVLVFTSPITLFAGWTAYNSWNKFQKVEDKQAYVNKLVDRRSGYRQATIYTYDIEIDGVPRQINTGFYLPECCEISVMIHPNYPKTIWKGKKSDGFLSFYWESIGSSKITGMLIFAVIILIARYFFGKVKVYLENKKKLRLFR